MQTFFWGILDQKIPSQNGQNWLYLTISGHFEFKISQFSETSYLICPSVLPGVWSLDSAQPKPSRKMVLVPCVTKRKSFFPSLLLLAVLLITAVIYDLLFYTRSSLHFRAFCEFVAKIYHVKNVIGSLLFVLILTRWLHDRAQIACRNNRIF